MLPFPALRHFSSNELNHPELVDNAFFAWLDEVRHRAGVPFRLTSDARTPEENARASGSSPTSLHLQGKAVDFTVRWEREVLWKVTHAVCTTPCTQGVELELVQGQRDRHIHLGWLGVGRASRLVLNID